MKLGADNPKKTGIAIALMVLSLLLLVRMMSSSSPPVTGSAASTDSSAATAKNARHPRTRQAPKVLADTLDPRLRLDLLKTSEQTTYAGSGRNIFRAEAEIVEIPKPIVNPVPPPYVPPQPPPPPPINLKFFGFANRSGEPKRVFLAQGDEVFVAAEGDIVNRRYKVMHIGVNSVEIQDVLNNNVQTIPLSQG